MNRNKSHVFLTILFAAAFICTAFGFQNSSQHKVFFEKAKFLMETKGDLNGAMELFEEIIAKYPDEREYAARAQYYIGLCYEKLGARQAQNAFQKVVENYPDQAEAVRMANKKLLTLTKAQGLADTSDTEFRIRKVFPFGADGIPSWDGRLLSYRADSGDLFIIDMATEKKKRLTDKADWGKGDFAGRSVISPDSKYITYSWISNYSDYDLKVTKIDGSEQRFLHSGKITPRNEAEYFWPWDWTPDSKYVLGTLIKGKEKHIVLISRADGSLETIKVFHDFGPEALDLSPDGRWLAYDVRQAKDSGRHDIFLMNAEGGRVTGFVKHPADDRLLGWTPSSDSILFASDRSGSWDVWVVPIKDGKASGDPILVKRDFGQVGRTNITPLGFTQNGSFYYEARSWMEEVHIAALDMEKAELLSAPRRAAQRFQGSNCYADWSPDGKYLAFSSRRGPNSSALCLFSIETEQQRDIFPDLETFARVNWFPDGKSVVVVGSDKQGQGGIYRVNIETGTANPIVTEGSGFHSPRCSPDGKYVYYEEDTSWEHKEFRIMKVHTDTGQKREIYRSAEQIIRLDISPDGKLLAFLEAADSTLKVMNSEGEQPNVVFKFEDGWSTSVAWSPDGKHLFFSKIPEGENKTGRIELWRIAYEGDDPIKLPLVAEGMENLRIHPDGKKISFNTFQVNSEVWVMENFLPQDKK